MDKDLHEEKGQPTDLHLEQQHLAVETAAGHLGGRIGHCFRNAYRHLRLSWHLHAIDSEMSTFRAITADEEASAALILALKQQGYPAAANLNFRNHFHKAGVSPFLDAMATMLAEAGVPTPRLSFLPTRPAIATFSDNRNFGYARQAVLSENGIS